MMSLLVTSLASSTSTAGSSSDRALPAPAPEPGTFALTRSMTRVAGWVAALLEVGEPGEQLGGVDVGHDSLLTRPAASSANESSSSRS